LLLTGGAIIRKFAQAAPVPCPITVTAFGLPPNACMLFLIHSKAAIWSNRPKLLAGMSPPLDFKNPK